MKQLVPYALLVLLCLCTPSWTQPQKDGPTIDWKEVLKELRDARNVESRIKGAKEIEQAFSRFHDVVSSLSLMVTSDPDPRARRQAAIALQAIGPSSARAVPNLVRALKRENDDGVRIQIISAIAASAPFSASAAPPSKEAIQLLISAVSDDNLDIRKRAIAGLGAFGPFAHAAVPALLRAMWDPDPGIPKKAASTSECAYHALRSIDPNAKVAFAAVVGMRRRDPAELRKLAPEEMKERFPDATKQVPFIAGLIGAQPDHKLRPYAAYALGMIGPDAKGAVRDLLRALADKSVENPETAKEIRIAVVWALGRIGPSARAAVPALKNLREGAEEPLRSILDTSIDQLQAR
jgi:HEAT repeat protein